MMDFKVTDIAGAPGSASLLIETDTGVFMYDAGFGYCAEKTAGIVEAELCGGKPECIILTHSHYDHVMGAARLADRWADVPVLAGEYTAFVFTRESARKLMYDMDINAAHELGWKGKLYADCTDRLHVDKIVNDGDIINVCGMKLSTLALPGHTRCSIGFFCEETRTLFSSETLGVYGEGTVMPNLLTSYVQGINSLEKAKALGAESIILPHYGIMKGAGECNEYFRIAENEFAWVRDNVIKCHASGHSESEIIEKIKERYYVGHIREVYPLRAFYLNTGYMVPKIIEEYC